MPQFKLRFERVDVPIADISEGALRTVTARGCSPQAAAEVTDHLIDVVRCGVESHGIVRVLQYAREYESGLLTANAPVNRVTDRA